jgi:cell division septation protein DedD
MPLRLQLEPEDFDGSHDRRPRGGKSGVVRAVLIAVGIVACAGALWGGYGLLRHSSGTATIPILHPDDRPIKVAPADRGAQQSADKGMWVLDPKRQQSGVEQLLPPPETPLQAPKPEPPVTDAAPTAPTPGTTPPAPSPVSGVTAAPSVPAAPVPVPAAPVVAPKPPVASAAPAPKPPVAVAPPAATPAAAPGGKGHRLQLGALRNSEAAQAEWERLKRAQSDLLGKLPGGVVRVDLGDRGIYYRIVAGPIADEARAESVCNALKQRKIGCILAKP